MELKQYQALAMRTAKQLSRQENLVHAALGVTSEAGELATAVKAHVIYGKELDRSNAMEELGDLMWFVSLMAETLEVSLEDIAQLNIAKLQLRYPNKYSDMDALARADKESV